VYALQIATIINCEYVGDVDFPIYGMNEIHVVEKGDIVFVDHHQILYKSFKFSGDCYFD
jgi:UDP-3-O-[3-hydroxymyristoyl] glucosamine N-acyltransferase